jgi:ubiquinone/menaquinone biosynthesis C-methylase UbiE
MPTLAENKNVFDGLYGWFSGGDGWSEAWGSAQAQWAGCLYPRVFPFLKGRILEIAPGHGRWTQFLRDHCTSLIGIDLSVTCVNECRSKYSSDPRLHFEVGDGSKLPMVSDASIDFAFSFDSLVHAEADILESYVAELARVLQRDAIAFIHHSNLAALADRSILDKLKRRWAGVPLDLSHWRAHSMSAKVMRKFAERVGMSCAQQELVPWGTGWPILMDCISTIINAPGRPCVIIENRRFVEETAMIRRISELGRQPAGTATKNSR